MNNKNENRKVNNVNIDECEDFSDDDDSDDEDYEFDESDIDFDSLMPVAIPEDLPGFPCCGSANPPPYTPRKS
jgi:hypothetical protein